MKLKCLELDGETYTVVDTARAKRVWEDATDFDGRNHIHRSTGQQFRYEKLYLSRKNRYYIVHWSDWQGEQPEARFVTPEEAAEWLALNDHELPEELRRLDVTE